MLDFLKALIEKLRVDLLLASLAIAILLYKVLGFDSWWMAFSLAVAYIALLCAEKGMTAIRQKKELKKKVIAQVEAAKKEESKLHDEVWKHFYALDSDTLELVLTIYSAEQDPTNPLRHFLRDDGEVYYKVDENYNLRITENDFCYHPLLYAELIDDASVITFDPYFMKLVAHYVITGKKESV